MYARAVTVASGVADAACPIASEPGPGGAQESIPSHRDLGVERRTVGGIDPGQWDALVAANPWATPFSAAAFQRAWWDAYGANAHDETLIVLDRAAPEAGPVAILPLMRRHAVEPRDQVVHTALRHGHEAPLTPVPAQASTLFMGASYHADYATLLAAPADLVDASRAIAAYLAGHESGPGTAPATPSDLAAWDVIDLRRLRCGDPAGDALVAAFQALAPDRGWAVTVEREDVCPVATIPDDADFDGFLATLDKKERHEIRRKVRRAEGEGEVRLTYAANPLAELDDFIDLHQARWGADGLFPPTEGGDQSRRFIRRLFELFGPEGPVRLTFLSVGERRIGAGVHLEVPDGFLYYNAGVDPGASSLSPGVLLVAAYVRLAISQGRHRLDFLRGDEGYKYQWGAVDEPIRRLLVRRQGPDA